MHQATSCSIGAHLWLFPLSIIQDIIGADQLAFPLNVALHKMAIEFISVGIDYFTLRSNKYK